ncbi:MAG: aldehyde dehydrogenase family protein [Janthinobacterium lividum]
MSQFKRDALYIGGEWVVPASGARDDVINPATEQVIGQSPVGGVRDVEEAISAARDAFDRGPWSRLPVVARVGYLEKMHAYLMSRQAEIVQMIIEEAGATAMIGQFLHFGIPMKHAAYLLKEAQRIEPHASQIEITPSFSGAKVLGTSVVVHDPVGVVAAITPYNFPFFLNVIKVFHALVMGNTLVLKPSPLTPFQALVFGEAAHAAGLPRGVLNVVTGELDAAQRLTTDPRIDMVTFTGSDKVGSLIAAQVAPTLKKLHLELGGKSALIVRADADLDAAAQAGVGGFTIHCGQGCALTTRHLVHNAVRAQYVQRLVALAESMKVGDPADATVTMGPLIRAQARERVEHYVAQGRASGARLATGGARPALQRGFFYQPTLFDGVDNTSAIAQEEIFGPVAVVIGFDSDEEAIALANDSAFGLDGGIFSRDVGQAYEMALQLRTGGVGLNGGAGTMLSAAPFGGIKRSGMGRENGREGLLEFTSPKSISFHAG